EALYHQIGLLLPNENCMPKFSQIYIFDGSFEAELKLHYKVFLFLDHDILTDIQHDFHMHNPFAQVFRSAGQFIHEGQPIMLKLLSSQGFDIKHYNRPTADEGQLQRISACHAAYNLLQYLLLFSYSQFSWHLSIFYSTSVTSNYTETLHNSVSDPENDVDFADRDLDNKLRQTQHRTYITIKNYAAYYLHICSPVNSILHHAAHLFHQYVVDQYAKIEQNHLLWQRTNQHTIHAELYQ
ncbi:18272_t:CDS:2, partial [Cetraspora pellucida]